MPNTSNYGFGYETPTSLPGPTLTGGPDGGSQILAVQVDGVLASIDNRVAENEDEITTINNTLDDRTQPVYGRVVLTGAQLLSNADVTRIEPDSIVYQSETLWDSSNFEFVIPSGRSGLYVVTASVSYESASGGRRSCDIETNHGRLSSDLNTVSETGNTRMTTSATYPLESGDVVWFTGFQTSGGDLNVSGEGTNVTNLAIARISPL